MGLSTPQGQRTQRPIPPAGLHPAICYAIIDMGTHQENFKGNVSNKPKVKFCFEFPTLPEAIFDEAKGPQRLSIMQDYNFYSDDKANLCKMLKQWRGVAKIDLAKDLPAYLGQSCQVMVVHTQKDDITYANIAASGTMIMPPAQNYGPAKNPLVLFDLDKFTWASFHSLWTFVQNKIKSSLDWNTILQKHGTEPVNPNAGTGGQQTMQPNTQFVQQPVQTAVPQMQQQVQYQQPIQQAPSFNNPVQNVQAPQFHSGHGNNQPVSNVNTQQFAPQVQETGIIVDNGTPPSF